MHDNPFSSPTSGPAAASPDPVLAPGKTGLGGWLILLGITLFISVLAKLVTLAQDFVAISSPDWQQLVTPGSPAYDPLWGPAVWVEILLTLGLLGFNIYVIALFFRKKATFPRHFTIFAVSNIVVIAVSLALCAQIHNFPKDAKMQIIKSVFQSLIYLGIWGSYVHKSLRVKRTFVR